MDPENSALEFGLEVDANARWLGEDVLLSVSTGRLYRFASGRGTSVRSLLERGRTTWDDPLTSKLVGAGVAHPVLSDLPRLGEDAITLVVPYGGGPVENLRPAVKSAQRMARTIVVDDRGAGSLPDLPSTVDALVHGRNRGPSAARNTGWQAASTPFVAFIDADAAPPVGWAAELGRHFVDPELALIAPRIRSTPGRSARHRLEAVRCPLDMGPCGGLVRHDSPRPYVPSTAWVVRRSALEEVGGFNEEMRLGEDVDLVWRLERAGWRVRYEPAIEVEHEPRENLGDWLLQRVGYGRSSADLWREHGDWMRHLEVNPRTAGPWMVGLACHSAAGLAAAAVSAWVMSRDLPVPHAAGLRLGAASIWRQGERIAEYGRRIGAFPLIAASPVSVVARRAFVGGALAYLAEWIKERPELDPLTYSLLRLVDDLAYGVGAWAGAISRRDLGSLGVGVRRLVEDTPDANVPHSK